MNFRKIRIGLILCVLAAVLLLGVVRLAGDVHAVSAAAVPLAQEPTATPLPTLVFDEEPSPHGALLATAVMLMCAMAGLMVAGIFAAKLLLRLRQRIKD